MSGAWEGGKGDKSRVTNYEAYGEGYDRIFKKEQQEMHKKSYLLLDDVRFAKDCVVSTDTSARKLLDVSKTQITDWVVVRTLKGFYNYIDRNGMPDVISFDNDLDSYDYQKYADAVNGKHTYVYETEKGNGIEAFRYVVNYCEKNDIELPKIYVHSANEFARRIINNKLKELGK